MAALDSKLLGRLYERSGAARWSVTREGWAAALDASLRKRAGGDATGADAARYLEGLHLEDLALACGCAEGHDAAWEHFVLQHRPVLYRAADAIAPGGAAREIADALYGDLFGMRERDGERQSLFRYFHGRSSLATWLRAVLSQRYVDRIRAERRHDPLPADEDPRPLRAPEIDPDRVRYVALLRATLAAALSVLAPRDRLRLSMYYVQGLTLAQAGKILGEHEATVSRQLARTRKELRRTMEDQLQRQHHLSVAEIARCFESVGDDSGPLDLGSLLSTAGLRKNAGGERST